MCENIKYVKNRRLDYKPYLHATWIPCACGKCDSCVRQRRESYANRSSFEMLRYVGHDQKRGGHAIFLLFTYNDRHLPYMIYKGNTVKCFNLGHIYDLIKILKDKYVHHGNGQFSYLIGPEYGTDPAHTQRAHYHALFMLSKEIDPYDFADFAEKVWTGRVYSRRTKGWKHGNLGFMFPFRRDRLQGQHLCRDNGACASYASKYATKQVGFYNNPIVAEASQDKAFKTAHTRCFPRVITSQKYGFLMLEQPSTDLVKGEVFNPLRGRVTPIPSYLMFCALHKRVYLGRRKEEETVRVNEELLRDMVCRIAIEDGYVGADDLVELIDLFVERDDVTTDIKIYDTPLTYEGVLIKVKQMDYRIDDLAKRACASLYLPYNVARRYAIQVLLYDSLPLGNVSLVEGIATDWMDMYNDKVWKYIYRHQLYKGRVEDYIDDLGSFARIPMTCLWTDCIPSMAQPYMDFLHWYLGDLARQRASSAQKSQEYFNKISLKEMLKPERWFKKNVKEFS